VQNNPIKLIDPYGLDAGIISGPAAYVAAGAIASGILYYGAPIAADAGKWLGGVLWNENDETSDSCDPERGLGEKWDDFQNNPEDWGKVDEKKDPRQPKDGYSRRENGEKNKQVRKLESIKRSRHERKIGIPIHFHRRDFDETRNIGLRYPE
jgi:hypothetical protein